MNEKIINKRFYDLSLDELYDILWLRNVVYVVGQKITAEAEVDGRDRECEHVLFYFGERLIGTARLFIDSSPISVGRIAIHTDVQSLGYGTKMMHFINARLGESSAMMHAQEHLCAWYESLGWRAEGDVFLEAGIRHITMLRN